MIRITVIFAAIYVGCVVLGKACDRFWIMLVDEAAKRRVAERPDD